MLNILKEVRKRNPYPKDIFTEPTKEEYIKLQRSIKDAGLVQDKFFGWYGHGVWNNCIDEINKVIEEELERMRMDEYRSNRPHTRGTRHYATNGRMK